MIWAKIVVDRYNDGYVGQVIIHPDGELAKPFAVVSVEEMDAMIRRYQRDREEFIAQQHNHTRKP